MENLVQLEGKRNNVFSRTKKYALEILTGDEVLGKISKKEFIAEWGLLYQNCPWATVYQSRDFIHLWYQTYHEKFLPILVVGLEDGILSGLFPLYKGKGKDLLGAGSNQAEYQTWISTVAGSDKFIQTALLSLMKKFPGLNLHLKYLPEQTPLQWAEADPFWKKTAWLQPVKHPLMRIDRNNLEGELRKKNKREKINRLKRLGDLKFERITHYADFLAIFDELASQNDFRKGAVYNAHHFHGNPLAKIFLLSLFKHNLLHATVLKVNNEIIASNVGTISGKWVHLQGINTHSPSHAKHSPGILHFLMLGQLLADEGFEVFDLTPGSDPYKDTLANDHIEAYKLNIKSPTSLMLSKLKFNFEQRLKSSLLKIGISRLQQRNYKSSISNAFEKIQIMKTHGPISLLTSILTFGTVKPYRFYTITSEKSPGRSFSYNINTNFLRDFLDFHPGGALLTKREFLEDAMKRMEAGQQSYSINKDSKLICSVWLEKEINKMQASKNMPHLNEEAFMLTNLYCHPLGENLLKEFLGKVLDTINLENPTGPGFAILRTNDRRICKVLEKLGFNPTEN